MERQASCAIVIETNQNKVHMHVKSILTLLTPLYDVYHNVLYWEHSSNKPQNDRRSQTNQRIPTAPPSRTPHTRLLYPSSPEPLQH